MPSKHARTGGKHKVEMKPKESDKGCNAEAEAIEINEEAEVEGIEEEEVLGQQHIEPLAR